MELDLLHWLLIGILFVWAIGFFWFLDRAMKQQRKVKSLAYSAICAISNAAQIVDAASRSELRTALSFTHNVPKRAGRSQSMANALGRAAEVHRNSYMELTNSQLKRELTEYNRAVSALLEELGEDPEQYRAKVPEDMPTQDYVNEARRARMPEREIEEYVDTEYTAEAMEKAPELPEGEK